LLDWVRRMTIYPQFKTTRLPCLFDWPIAVRDHSIQCAKPNNFVLRQSLLGPEPQSNFVYCRYVEGRDQSADDRDATQYRYRTPWWPHCHSCTRLQSVEPTGAKGHDIVVRKADIAQEIDEALYLSIYETVLRRVRKKVFIN